MDVCEAGEQLNGSLTDVDWLHHMAPPTNSQALMSPTTKPARFCRAAEETLPPELLNDPLYIKPSISYAALITEALTAKQYLTLNDIYSWVMDNYPYYRIANPAWKNSIRHNLSLCKQFIKLARNESDLGRGSYWTLDPKAATATKQIRLRNGKQVLRKRARRCSPVLDSTASFMSTDDHHSSAGLDDAPSVQCGSPPRLRPGSSHSLMDDASSAADDADLPPAMPPSMPSHRSKLVPAEHRHHPQPFPLLGQSQPAAASFAPAQSHASWQGPTPLQHPPSSNLLMEFKVEPAVNMLESLPPPHEPLHHQHHRQHHQQQHAARRPRPHLPHFGSETTGLMVVPEVDQFGNHFVFPALPSEHELQQQNHAHHHQQQHRYLPSLHVGESEPSKHRAPLRPVHNLPMFGADAAAMAACSPLIPHSLVSPHHDPDTDYQLFLSRLEGHQPMSGLTPMRAQLGGTGFTPARLGGLGLGLDAEMLEAPAPLDLFKTAASTASSLASTAMPSSLSQSWDAAGAHHQHQQASHDHTRAALWHGNAQVCSTTPFRMTAMHASPAPMRYAFLNNTS
mgnify:CR=1 FL=1